MLALRSRLTGIAAELPPTFWFLWVGTIVNRLGSFVIPFLSLYLTSQRGLTVSQAGLMISLFGAGAFLSHIVGGELTDRLGRRPVLLLSLFVTPVLTISLGLGRAIPLIAASTFVLGLFMDLYRPAVNAAVADLVAPSLRTRAYGYLYWAINLGVALAPIIAGLMARVNYLLLFVGDALTTFLYGLIVLWRVPETQPASAVHEARIPAGTRLRQLGSEPILLAFAALTFFGAMIYVQYLVTMPLDMSQHGLGPADYGLAIASNAILVVLITIQASRVVGKWPRFVAVSVAVLLIGLGFGLNRFASTLPFYILAVAVWTLGEVINAAVAPSIVADLSPVQLRGLYQGVWGAAWGLALFVGPLLGSWVFQQYSAASLWVGCAILGTLLAAGYLILARPAHRRLASAG